MKQLLLDTNAYSELVRGNTTVPTILAEADTVLMSIFVLGELFAGFRGRKRETANRTILQEFLSESSVETIEATTKTAEVFAQIMHHLRSQGTPIPINDVWIAAHAMEKNAWLYTFDKHFQHIPGLQLWQH